MVGPRAYVKKELQEQTKKYPKTKKLLPKILSVKPGITGLWQTSGRNEIPFTKRAELDAYYATHTSLKKDIEVITNEVTKIFHDNCKSLNCLKPTEEPKATDHIKEMIEMSSSLISKGLFK